MNGYSTKVMRPANLRGLSETRETIDKAIAEAEQQSLSGDLVLTLHLKQGSMIGAKVTSTKCIPLEERNN